MAARYSRQTGYTLTKRSTRTSNRAPVRTVQRRVKFGPTTAKFMGLAVLAILAIVMLTQQASTDSTNAYKKNDLQVQVSSADQETERLRLEAKRAQTLEAIQQTPVKDQMQSTGKVEYIEKGDVAGVSAEKKQ